MPRDSMIEGVNDSKKISESKREMLYEKITSEAISYAVRNNWSWCYRWYKYFECY